MFSMSIASKVKHNYRRLQVLTLVAIDLHILVIVSYV